MSTDSGQSRRLRQRDRPRLGRGARSTHRSTSAQRHSLAHAPPAASVPPSLARRRPRDPRRSTLGDPDSSSIAGRASGFLQVSLSKGSRHSHRGARPASGAETSPMNANDFSLLICSDDDSNASIGRLQRGLLRWISATRARTMRLISAVGSDRSSGNWIVPFDVLKSARSFANRTRTEPPGNRLT
jgi:hypothetical protein